MIESTDQNPLSESDDLQLNAYIDNEMPSDTRATFELRLAAEPGLRAAHDRLDALRRVIGSTIGKGSVSDTLRARIVSIGAIADRAHRPSVVRRVDWRMLAATAVISAGASGLLTNMLITRPTAFAASAAIVAVHQHALLSANPVEVASSDRHTVRPWFDGKLALSPRVVDLAGDDFPLIGGRIDVVEGHRVPVLVYRHRAHLVTVVAVPEAGSRDTGAGAVHATRDGYSVLTWRGSDFQFSAISDVADGELADFVTKLRRAMQAV